ncbi:MAG: response regulator [Pyrinomonadaceae bacterium]
MKHKLLIVDDEEANLRALVRLFSAEYEPIAASSGKEAMMHLTQHDFAMIISDQRMPEMSGLDFLKRAADLRPQTVRLLLTGYTDVDTLVEAINSGVVYKFVAKPWSNEDLMQLVKRALEHFEAVRKGHNFNHDILRLNQKLDAASEALVLLWTENLRLRSAELLAHAERISRTARAISDLLPIDAEQVELNATAARLFPMAYSPADIPRILAGVPCTSRELEIKSNELDEALAPLSRLRALEDFNEICTIIRFANEYFDGSGFPNRLAGESIPLASRILSAARGYDLLTNVDLENFRLTHDMAIEHMLRSPAAVVYDPSIVQILDRIEPNFGNPEIVFVPESIPMSTVGRNGWIGID